jgi:hypothetical protein
LPAFLPGSLRLFAVHLPLGCGASALRFCCAPLPRPLSRVRMSDWPTEQSNYQEDTQIGRVAIRTFCQRSDRFPVSFFCCVSPPLYPVPGEGRRLLGL